MLHLVNFNQFYSLLSLFRTDAHSSIPDSNSSNESHLWPSPSLLTLTYCYHHFFFHYANACPNDKVPWHHYLQLLISSSALGTLSSATRWPSFRCSHSFLEESSARDEVGVEGSKTEHPWRNSPRFDHLTNNWSWCYSNDGFRHLSCLDLERKSPLYSATCGALTQLNRSPRWSCRNSANSRSLLSLVLPRLDRYHRQHWYHIQCDWSSYWKWLFSGDEGSNYFGRANH